MLTTFLIIVILLLGGALIGLSYLFIKNNERFAEAADAYEDKIDYWHNQTEHYRIEFENMKGKDQVIAYEALEQGLEEAVDDHAQEQATWTESRIQYEAVMIQYEAVIDDLKKQIEENDQQIHQLQSREANSKDIIDGLRAELSDVRETALRMQIDLQAKE